MRTPLLLLFLLCTTGLSAQSWQPLVNAPNLIGPLSKLDDVHFINASTGWTISSQGKVFKTEDGGENWQEQADLNEFLRCVKFANEDVGYVGSLMGSFGGPPSNARIFKTEDGGASWTDLTAAISPEPIGICGLSVVDEQTVYGCGAFYGPARVYKSLDGGASWTTIDLSGLATNVVDLHFFTADFGFVIGAGTTPTSGGVILRTEDGGANWEVVHNTMVPSDLLWKIQALDEDHLYAAIAGVSMVNGARILVSEDGGASWTSRLVAAGEIHLQGLGFISPERGFAGGFFEGLYETRDGGASWEQILVGANYNRFQKINDSLMYASGHTIYAFSDSSDIMTSTAEILAPPSYSMTVAPNPASDQFRISYTLQNPTHLQLRLYDTQGKIVQTFFEGWHPGGEFQVDAAIGQLPAGMYIVGFLSREGDILQKVLIEK
ncbi:MAG: YCF48-related protein [Bacteroidota bacterium]